MRRFFLPLCVLAILGACSDSQDQGVARTTEPQTAVDSGSLELVVTADPWGLHFTDEQGEEILAEVTDTGTGPSGSLGVFPGPPSEGAGAHPSLTPLVMGDPQTPTNRDTGWVRATRLLESDGDGVRWKGRVATTDPGIFLTVAAQAQDDGVIGVVVEVEGAGVQATSIAFGSEPDERLVGFGERGNSVNQAGNVLENYVAEGPYQDNEYPFVNAVVPAAGVRWRRDTTYFPIPWLLSSRGYGVLLDNDEISYHRLDSAGTWALEVESAEMRFRVFAGPRPADALRRFTASLGTQPREYAPWFFGPWVQSDYDERIDELRELDVPTSVTATYTHYLPCGSQVGHEAELTQRTAERNANGTAVHTYFNPMICTGYLPEFKQFEDSGALIENGTGETYIYTYVTSSIFTVSQFDFTTEAAVEAFRSLTDQALDHGFEGWMEDFGEYTPLDAVSSDGITGTAFHNRYPRDYHCGAAAATSRAGKPLARFVRSGWTGSAACSPIVWGGDPTVTFGFDGLESSVYQALSMGTSGVGIWGSDIGGFHAFNPNYLSSELFDRWIAFGALSVVMRSQKDGINIGVPARPQLWEPEHIDTWRKYAKLHTQLYPYIQAAVEEYYRSGMPVMRHHVLTDPGDSRAHGRDNQYMFGPDLLVAPVVREGVAERALYLPGGAWIEWWRSTVYNSESGGFSLGDLRIHQGQAEVTVAAPPGEIPIFVRAGAVIPMLAPDVHTLAAHGDGNPDVIRLADRSDQLYLLAFPRAETGGNYFDSGSYTSVVDGDRWTLTLDDAQARTVHLQAGMRAMQEPFVPCQVRVGGSALDESEWSYDTATEIFSVNYDSGDGALEVEGC